MRLCALVRQNYLPPPRHPNFGRSREGYGRYDFPVFSRIRVSTVDLATQSSILLSGGGGRQFFRSLLCVCKDEPYQENFKDLKVYACLAAL